LGSFSRRPAMTCEFNDLQPAKSVARQRPQATSVVRHCGHRGHLG
jgi:hypothetical protein